MFGVRGWQWRRQVALPGVFPYYVTGALTASGGSWNASIVAEAVSWGNQHLEAHGLGTYIAKRADLLANTAELFHMVETGAVKIAINQRYPLSAAADAHRDLEARKTTGSTVFTL